MAKRPFGDRERPTGIGGERTRHLDAGTDWIGALMRCHPWRRSLPPPKSASVIPLVHPTRAERFEKGGERTSESRFHQRRPCQLAWIADAGNPFIELAVS
jgi:hypothetical protein